MLSICQGQCKIMIIHWIKFTYLTVILWLEYNIVGDFNTSACSLNWNGWVKLEYVKNGKIYLKILK